MSDTLQSSKYNVHDTLIELVNTIEEDTVALALSSGIDSLSILLALLECGKKVIVYSFHLDDVQSRDFLVAQDVAKQLNLKFVPIVLPSDIDTLKSDIKIMARKYDCVKKTDFECFWPYMYLMKQVEESVLASGMAADGHFAISKKAMIHFKDNVQTFRDNYFSNPNRCQLIQREKLAEELNLKLFDPYLSNEMISYLYDSSWDECNKPYQKMPIRQAFDYEKYVKIYPHTNFQLGDSGISKHFEKLLDTNWNINNYKSVTGIYNSVVRGELDHAMRKLI